MTIGIDFDGDGEYDVEVDVRANTICIKQIIAKVSIILGAISVILVSLTDLL
jgi:hypothetical protein